MTVSINIGKQVAFFQDDSKALTINNILSPYYQSQFKTYHKDVFTHPVTRGAFWFKISIENKSGSAAWLQLGTINARYIDFYAPDSNGIYSHPLLTGVMRGESSKPYPVNTFWLPVNTEHQPGPLTYYIRVLEESPVEVPLRLGTLECCTAIKPKANSLQASSAGSHYVSI